MSRPRLTLGELLVIVAICAILFATIGVSLKRAPAPVRRRIAPGPAPAPASPGRPPFRLLDAGWRCSKPAIC